MAEVALAFLMEKPASFVAQIAEGLAIEFAARRLVQSLVLLHPALDSGCSHSVGYAR